MKRPLGRFLYLLKRPDHVTFVVNKLEQPQNRFMGLPYHTALVGLSPGRKCSHIGRDRAPAVIVRARTRDHTGLISAATAFPMRQLP